MIRDIFCWSNFGFPRQLGRKDAVSMFVGYIIMFFVVKSPTGWWLSPPLWKIWKSNGIVIPKIWKNNPFMLQTTNQPIICWFNPIVCSFGSFQNNLAQPAVCAQSDVFFWIPNRPNLICSFVKSVDYGLICQLPQSLIGKKRLFHDKITRVSSNFNQIHIFLISYCWWLMNVY